ncbi:DUF523 domain-containing protein [Candidatus Beckwithbacteria bacterium]|nr:DUF523 domain-containing protein [Candidatus Beckwithbacteria bacterium]
MKRKNILVSACLVGVNCRYDGSNKLNEKIIKLLEKKELIIVCPELLGGFPIPRSPCQIVGGDGYDVLQKKAKVMGEDGIDYSQQFIKGAKNALRIARENNVSVAYLREKSPSCGSGEIYNGKGLKNGDGVFAALLKQNGIKVVRI